MNRFNLVGRIQRSSRSPPSKKLGGGQSQRSDGGPAKRRSSDLAQTPTASDAASASDANGPDGGGIGIGTVLRGAHHLRRRRSSRGSLGSTGSMDSARSLAFADMAAAARDAGDGSSSTGRGQGQQRRREGSWSSVDRRLSQYSRRSASGASRRRSSVGRSASMEIKRDALRQLQAGEARFENFCDDPNFPTEWGRDEKKGNGHRDAIDNDASVHSADSFILHPNAAKAPTSSASSPGAQQAYWHRLAVRSSTPDTPPNELVRRAAFMLMSSLTCGAGLVWALMYAALREPVAAFFPTAYSVLMTLCFLCLTTEGRYHQIVFVQLLLILLLPVCLQLSVGGIVRGGAVMIWSFLCPLGAALFCSSRTAKRWFVLYFLCMVGALLHELCSLCPFRTSYHSKPVPLGNLEVGMFIMNICGAMTITFLGALFFSMKLDEEFHRSEELLYNILPRSIAKRLKGGENHIVENFEAVTILFADLVGFTKASSELNANFLIGMVLRDVFIAWDALCEKRSIEKIKTIGDAYMCVGGLEATTESKSVLTGGREGRVVAHEMVILGLEMKKALDKVNRKYGTSFQVRIGLHSGPCIAGVIGVKKFAYDVWGDAVNTASRMESHGVPGEIHISSDTYNKIKHLSYLKFKCCGEIQVKGKGMMVTYLARRREQFRDESISKLAYESSPESSTHLCSLTSDSESREEEHCQG